jgi:hypothetical protein
VKAVVKEVVLTAQEDCGDQILTMWQLGQRVISLDNHEVREDAQGKKVQAQAIAVDLLGMSGSTLEKALQLFRTFPKESEIKALVAKRTQSGLALSWEHVQVLLLFRPDLAPSNRRKFDTWLEKIVENDLSPSDLKRAISSADSSRSDLQHYQVDPEPTFERRCEKLKGQVRFLCAALVREHQGKFFGILAALRDMPASELQDHREAIQEHLCQVADLLPGLRNALEVMEEDFLAGQRLLKDRCSECRAGAEDSSAPPSR